MIPSRTNFRIRLDTQEKPGPIRNVAVTWFLLIFPQYFLAVLLDYEDLRGVFLVFYKALNPLYKTVHIGDRHRLHLSLPYADLSFWLYVR